MHPFLRHGIFYAALGVNRESRLSLEVVDEGHGKPQIDPVVSFSDRLIEKPKLGSKIAIVDENGGTVPADSEFLELADDTRSKADPCALCDWLGPP